MANINMTQGQLDSVVTAINNRAKTTDVNNGLATKVDKVASTDNAIVRFDGINGSIKNSNVFIDNNGNITLPSFTSGTNSGISFRAGFSPDANVGIYVKDFSGSNADGIGIAAYDGLSIHTGSSMSERMRVDSSGNIGIGTSSPSGFGKLAVKGQIAPVSPDEISQGVFAVDNTGKVTVGGYNSSGTNYLSFTAGGGNERMRIDANGNVGIGTSSPAGKLSIMDTNGGMFIDGTNVTYNRLKSHTTNIGTDKDLLITTSGTGTSGIYVNTSGNVGIGVTPSAWYGTYKALQINNTSLTNQSNVVTRLSTNYYIDSSNVQKYIASDYATQYMQANGAHMWDTAPSGTAGSTINWTTAMTLNSSGRLLIGGTTDNGVDKLQVNGDVSSNNLRKSWITFTALNTWFAIENISGHSGIYCARNNTHGGTIMWMADPNGGAIAVANNVLGGVNYELVYSPDGSNRWKIRQTAGSLTTLSISYHG